MDDGTLIAYRQRVGDNVWHWCRTCPQWPQYSESVEMLSEPPPNGRCPECEAIERGPEYCEPNPA